jgi:hypothetical protein
MSLGKKNEILAGTFGCRVGSLPFTYLGLPLGVTKPKIEDFNPSWTRFKGSLLLAPLYSPSLGGLNILIQSLLPL